MRLTYSRIHITHNCTLRAPCNFQGSQSANNVPSWLRVFRLCRVVRLLKLSKYSEGLQLMGKTLQRNAGALAMLLFAEGVDHPLHTWPFAAMLVRATRNKTRPMRAKRLQVAVGLLIHCAIHEYRRYGHSSVDWGVLRRAGNHVQREKQLLCGHC